MNESEWRANLKRIGGGEVRLRIIGDRDGGGRSWGKPSFAWAWRRVTSFFRHPGLAQAIDSPLPYGTGSSLDALARASEMVTVGLIASPA